MLSGWPYPVRIAAVVLGLLLVAVFVTLDMRFFYQGF